MVSDPTDYKGLPFPTEDGKEAIFLPFGELNSLITATKPTVFFLDDLGQAPMSVQAACMQLILARQIDGHKVSDEVVFVAASNRRQDKAGVLGILEPVKSRFAAILELEPNTEDWVEWAYANKMPANLISFIQFKPQFLSEFKPTSDLTNSPCPRTVAYVGKMINNGVPKDLLYEMVSGAAGNGFATEFKAYLDIYTSIPSLSELMAKADTLPIPTDPGQLYAYSGFIADNNNSKNIPRLIKFIERMNLEFQTLVMTQTIKVGGGKNSTVSTTREFLDWSMNHAKTIY